MSTRIITQTRITCVAMILSGCAESNVERNGNVSPAVVYSPISQPIAAHPNVSPVQVKKKTIAVMPFGGDTETAGIVIGGIEEKLLNCGSDIIDRSRVETVLRERKDPNIDYAAIGKLLGVDIFISGSIQLAPLSSLNGGRVRSMTYRATDSQTGRIIWSGSFNKTFAPTPLDAGHNVGEKACAEMTR